MKWADIKGMAKGSHDLVQTAVGNLEREYRVKDKDGSGRLDITIKAREQGGKVDVTIYASQGGSHVGAPNACKWWILDAIYRIRKAVRDWKAGEGEYPAPDFFGERQF